MGHKNITLVLLQGFLKKHQNPPKLLNNSQWRQENHNETTNIIFDEIMTSLQIASSNFLISSAIPSSSTFEILGCKKTQEE
jgi:hypothetical protein